MSKKTELVQEEAAQTLSLPPMGFEVIRREFKRDKIAMAALIVLIAILVFIFIAPFFMDIEEATKVNIFNRFTPPGQEGYLLGSDEGGRDILAQLLIVGVTNALLSVICNDDYISGGYCDWNFLVTTEDSLMILPCV